MRIGILTYHFGTNFGGQLQCYALFKTLEYLGHQPVIINYTPQNYKNNFWGDIKLCLKKLFSRENNRITLALTSIFYSHRMRKRFSTFRHVNLIIGPRCQLANFSVFYNKLDAVVVGSDQVWAPAHHNTGAYFLNFSPHFNLKKIAYAPCCAINKIELKYRAKISRLLADFDSLSARNIETQDFVYDLIGKKVEIVADPTVLYDFNDLHSSRLPMSKYVLVYILGDDINGGHYPIIKSINEIYQGLPIYVMSLTNGKAKYFSWASKTYWDLAPNDWVDFIRHASFVYTDSFHGVMFSLKFNIPFLAYYKEKIRASRFIDLKKRFDLNNIIDSSENVNPTFISTSQPDFFKINARLLLMKHDSIDYLKKALS